MSAAVQHAAAELFAWPTRRPLLTAEWRNLALLNYEVDPRVVTPLLPCGTELDEWNGAVYVSIVGFQFLRTRFCGVAVPLHTNFPEINLRFYIRRRCDEGWRRGVAFIRELAPRRAVAWLANALYGEQYLTAPMSCLIEPRAGGVPRRLEYRWRRLGGGGAVVIEPGETGQRPLPDSHEHFIIEHYWGYTALSTGRTMEYEVAHPPWIVSSAASAAFECESAAAIYGEPFAEIVRCKPTSAFWADGSAVRVYRGRRLDGQAAAPQQSNVNDR